MTINLGFGLILVLMGHLLADFYVQTNSVAQNKNSDNKAFALHAVLYALCMLPFCLIVFAWWSSFLISWTVISLTHALIDLAKREMSNRDAASLSTGKRPSELASFCLDQIAHIILCSAVVVIAFSKGALVSDAWFFLPLQDLMGGGDTLIVLAIVITAFLFNGRPVSCLIQLIFKQIRLTADSDNPQQQDEQRAGRWIGVFERMLVVILTLCGQFGAIAFVLAAKSIARFKQLDDQTFAESYLIGTLASMTFAIVSSLCLQNIATW